MIRRQDGFAVLSFSIMVAAALAGVLYFVSMKSSELTRRYEVAQGQLFAQDLAGKLGAQVRWSYDIWKADTTGALCATSYGGTLTAVGAFQLCITGGAICVPHPRDAHPVCIIPNTDLIASRSPGTHQPQIAAFMQILISQAYAAPWSPPAPAAGETANAITPPSCVDGPCAVQCSTNADCLTFRFCPLVGTCSNANQFVWQTIAMLK